MPEPGARGAHPLPFLASRRRRGATELCRMAILGLVVVTDRMHLDKRSGTRLILIHRMNGWGEAIGIRRPRCSYLCCTVRLCRRARNYSLKFQALRDCVAVCFDSAPLRLLRASRVQAEVWLAPVLCLSGTGTPPFCYVLCTK
jgi:hypothetical protein